MLSSAGDAIEEVLNMIESVTMGSLHDIVNYDLQSFSQPYILSPELWERFTLKGLGMDFSNWCDAKMMDEKGELNKSLSKIPTKYGGIYVYYISSPVIPKCGSYIMYVGMASKTQTENLRARIRSYKKQFGDGYTRERLHRLFVNWGKYVYIRYLPINATKSEIEELETRLIATITPPCNADCRVKSIKRAVNAFR